MEIKLLFVKEKIEVVELSISHIELNTVDEGGNVLNLESFLSYERKLGYEKIHLICLLLLKRMHVLKLYKGREYTNDIDIQKEWFQAARSERNYPLGDFLNKM
ncbi:hypothetical protein JNUCC74_17825 [Cerasibacillus sp. JNUCC 74]